MKCDKCCLFKRCPAKESESGTVCDTGSSDPDDDDAAAGDEEELEEDEDEEEE